MGQHDDDDEPQSGPARSLWSLGKVAGASAKLWMKKRDEEGRIGAVLAQELDQMKGLAMKVGQIVSYFDGVLPPETHDALVRLQRGATPVAFEVMRRVVEEALGASLSRCFDRFDPEPVASASIGQVYRATFEGREVAVKVQYPNIRDTMVSDVSRSRSISRLASLATAVDGPSIVGELAAQMEQECDYLREAENRPSSRSGSSTTATFASRT